MAFTFSCPSCRAELRLPDEAAGQSGQCPRCQAVMRIPSSTQPRAVVIDPATGVPKEQPAPPPAKPVPSYDRAQPSRRQPRPSAPAAPPKPTGPIWPTAVGVIGGLICLGLLFASVVTLFSVRATESVRPKVAQSPEEVSVGRLEGRRAVLVNGVFQVHTQLAPNDAFDPLQINCRCKRYEIHLLANRTYVIVQDSPNFDGILRVEMQNHQVLKRDGGPGRRNAMVEYRPRNTEIHVIYVTSDQPALGPLTLTVSEADFHVNPLPD